MINRSSILAIGVLAAVIAKATDVVPHQAKSTRVVAEGYVEIAGPRKIKVNGESLFYDSAKYVRIDSIGIPSGVHGTTKRCMIAYSSESYTKNVSDLEQFCNEILAIIEGAK